MFGMEPSAQLQEYSIKFFHTIKPQKKKIKKPPYVTVTQEAGLKYTKAKKYRVEWKVDPVRSAWSVRDSVRQNGQL